MKPSQKIIATIRGTEAERRKVADLAKESGLSINEFVRNRIWCRGDLSTIRPKIKVRLNKYVEFMGYHLREADLWQMLRDLKGL